MRSSKSRSRSKQNRPRSIGNIVNRVFDSSGPEGKVRGTPQQIIEKYQALARDAQLSNDRVAAENFLQHAEHYTRMLGEAMRELAAEQEARRSQHGGNGNGHGNGVAHGQGNNGHERPWQQRREDRADDSALQVQGFEDVSSESDLIETPESLAIEPVEVMAAQPEIIESQPVVAAPARETLEARAPREGRETREPREAREPRAVREPREAREPRQPREAREPRDATAAPRERRQGNREERAPQGETRAPRAAAGNRRATLSATQPAAAAAEGDAPKVRRPRTPRKAADAALEGSKLAE